MTIGSLKIEYKILEQIYLSHLNELVKFQQRVN